MLGLFYPGNRSVIVGQSGPDQSTSRVKSVFHGSNDEKTTEDK